MPPTTLPSITMGTHLHHIDVRHSEIPQSRTPGRNIIFKRLSWSTKLDGGASLSFNCGAATTPCARSSASYCSLLPILKTYTQVSRDRYQHGTGEDNMAVHKG